MKFTRHQPDRHPPRRLTRATEALGLTESPAEGVFDIRTFLAGSGVDYLRMIVNVENPQEDDYELFMNAGWVGNLDQEIGEGLRQVPGLKEYMLEKFDDEYASQGSLSVGQFMSYLQLTTAIQIFPEVRLEAHIQNQLTTDFQEMLEIIGDSNLSLSERVAISSTFSPLLPGRRDELVAKFLKPYHGQTQELLSCSDFEEMLIEEKTALLFLFPELHEQLVSLVRPQMNDLQKQWDTVSRKKLKSEEEVLEYFELAHTLTIAPKK